jgi:glutathione synthase/RimK-type ligase-like ATP-grasp enzyme
VIVVISHPDDRHAVVVMEALRRHGADVVLLDLAELPDRSTITVDYADPCAPTVVLVRDGERSVLSDATAVWWRRPQSPTLDSITDVDVLGFTHGEWFEALNGLYQLLDCPWLNDPIRNEIASRKAIQLKVAAELGLRVPRTLMTSDADAALRFARQEGIGNVIYKTFASTHQVWRETRLLRTEDLSMFDSLRYAPVIFQEHIPAAADVRVTVVGEQVFPLEIDARRSGYDVDFRVDMAHATTRAATLPDDVEKRLRRLMERFELGYGAIDLRRTPDGDYVFLEINPAGEFLFAEYHGGFRITEAVAGWLRSPT